MGQFQIRIPGLGQYDVEADSPDQLDAAAQEIRQMEGPARKKALLAGPSPDLSQPILAGVPSFAGMPMGAAPQTSGPGLNPVNLWRSGLPSPGPMPPAPEIGTGGAGVAGIPEEPPPEIYGPPAPGPLEKLDQVLAQPAPPWLEKASQIASWPFRMAQRGYEQATAPVMGIAGKLGEEAAKGGARDLSKLGLIPDTFESEKTAAGILQAALPTGIPLEFGKAIASPEMAPYLLAPGVAGLARGPEMAAKVGKAVTSYFGSEGALTALEGAKEVLRGIKEDQPEAVVEGLKAVGSGGFMAAAPLAHEAGAILAREAPTPEIRETLHPQEDLWRIKEKQAQAKEEARAASTEEAVTKAVAAVRPVLDELVQKAVSEATFPPEPKTAAPVVEPGPVQKGTQQFPEMTAEDLAYIGAGKAPPLSPENEAWLTEQLTKPPAPKPAEPAKAKKAAPPPLPGTPGAQPAGDLFSLVTPTRGSEGQEAVRPQAPPPEAARPVAPPEVPPTTATPPTPHPETAPPAETAAGAPPEMRSEPRPVGEPAGATPPIDAQRPLHDFTRRTLIAKGASPEQADAKMAEMSQRLDAMTQRWLEDPKNAGKTTSDLATMLTDQLQRTERPAAAQERAAAAVPEETDEARAAAPAAVEARRPIVDLIDQLSKQLELFGGGGPPEPPVLAEREEALRQSRIARRERRREGLEPMPRGTPGGVGSRVVYDILGRLRELKGMKGMPLTGKVVKSDRLNNPMAFAAELESMVRVYRHPQVETLRVYALKRTPDGSGYEIIGQSAISSRLPGSATFFPEAQKVRAQALAAGKTLTPQAAKLAEGRIYNMAVEDEVARLNKWLTRQEADGWFMSHNHPSGGAKPSKADLTLTSLLQLEIPGFMGHVVTNHGEFGWIPPRREISKIIEKRPSPGSGWVYTPPHLVNERDFEMVYDPRILNVSGAFAGSERVADPLRAVQTGMPLPEGFVRATRGGKISRWEHLAAAAQWLGNRSPSTVTAVFADTKDRVNLVTDYPANLLTAGDLDKPAEMPVVQLMRKNGREAGATAIYFTYDGQDPAVRAAISRLFATNYITDAFLGPPNQVSGSLAQQAGGPLDWRISAAEKVHRLGLPEAEAARPVRIAQDDQRGFDFTSPHEDILGSLEETLGLGKAAPEPTRQPAVPSPPAEKQAPAAAPLPEPSKPRVEPLLREKPKTVEAAETGLVLNTKAEGDLTRVTTIRPYADGAKVSVPVRYALAEANDPSLIVSHDIDGKANPKFPVDFLQPRGRGARSYREQAIERAQAWNPPVVGQSALASAGAPIVAKDGIVESGNGRVISLRHIYSDLPEKAAEYKTWLKDNADLFGIDPAQIDAMKEPVLVRVREGEMPPERRREFVRLANESDVSRPTSVDEAKSDSEVITPEMMKLLNTGPSGELSDPDNMAFVDRFMQALEPGRKTEVLGSTKTGEVTANAYDAIRNALFFKAYGDVELLRQLVEAPDTEIKTALKGLVSAAPDFARLKSLQDQGKLVNLDFTQPVMEALKKLDVLRRYRARVGASQFNLEDYVNNLSLFGDGSQAQRAMLALFADARGGVNKIRDFFGALSSVIETVADESNVSLFETPQPTVDEMYNAAVRIAEGADENADLGEMVRRVSRRIAERGQPRPGGGRPEDTGRGPEEVRPPERPVDQPPVPEARPAPVGGERAAEAGGAGRTPETPPGPVEPKDTETGDLFRLEQERTPAERERDFQDLLDHPDRVKAQLQNFRDWSQRLQGMLSDPADVLEYRKGRKEEGLSEARQRVRAQVVGPEDMRKNRGFLTKVERARQRLERAPLAVEKVEDLMLKGEKVPVWQRPGLLYRWALAHDARADVMAGWGTFRWDDKGNPVWTGDSVGKILDPLRGRFNEVRDYMAAVYTLELAKEKPRKALDLTKPEIKAMVDIYGPGIWTGVPIKSAEAVLKDTPPEIRKAGDDISAWLKRVGQYGVDAGILSQKQFDNLRRGHYFPLYRVEKGDPALYSKLKGSTRQFLDPLVAAVDMGRRIIRAADLNRTKIALADLADAGAKEVVNPLAGIVEKSLDTDTGLSDLAAALKRAAAEDGLELSDEMAELLAHLSDRNLQQTSAVNPAFSVARAGKRETYHVDPDLGDSLGALSPVEVAAWMRVLGMVSRGLRAGTTKNPMFGILNYLRDNGDAAINTRTGLKPYLDTLPELLNGARDALKGRHEESLKRQEFLVSGAGYSDITGGPGVRTAAKILAEVAPKSVLGHAVYELRHPVEALGILGRPFEEATRIAEMERARKAGKSLIEAGDDAADVTTNFRVHGTKLQAWASMVAFLNPNIQGLAKNVRAFRENPVGFLAKGALMLSLPSAMLWLANRGDEEIEELRKAPYGRNRWFFRDPFSKRIWSVPKPFLYGSGFGTGVESMLDAWADDDPTAVARWASEFSSHATLNAFPTGIENPGLAILQFMPTAAQIGTAMVGNIHPYFLNPIVPDRFTKLEPGMQAQPTTTKTARAVGETLGISPAKLEYVTTATGGTLGLEILRNIDRLMPAGDTPRPTEQMADLPIIGRVSPRTPSASAFSIQRFYDDLARVERARDSYQAKVKEETSDADSYYEKNATLIEAAPVYEETRTTLADLRKEIERVRKAKDLTPDQKRKDMDDLIRQMIEAAKTTNSQDLVTPEEKRRRPPVLASDRPVLEAR